MVTDVKKTDLGPPAVRVTPTTIDAQEPVRGTIAESDPPTSVLRPSGPIDLPPGTIVGDNYEIDARLGAGAMGEVYAARHTKLGKRVAIKVIGSRLSDDAGAIERFAMEARTLAQIQHPAIVAVEHVGELADGRAFFVMEYLRGESLFERLQRGRVELSEALRILDQVARGLEAAHKHGVVHRDLKPENVYLVYLPGEPALVKLVDFGLAKLRADVDDVRAERTQSGVTIGTPLYMSPEQARGPDVDHRTDIYALGCVAYELILETSPFPHAKTIPALWAAHLHESPPLPRSIWPDVPPQLDLVLFAMLAKDPDHRPTLTQVRSVLATLRGSSAQRAATELVVPKTRRLPVPAMVAAISAATLAGGIFIGGTLTKSTGVPFRPTVPTVTLDAKPTPSAVTLPPPQPLPAPPPPVIRASIPPRRVVGSAHAAHLVPSGSAAIAAEPASGSAELPIEGTPPAVATTKHPDPIDSRRTKNPFDGSGAPIDKNQTVNPFAPKRDKATP
jgi:serine/threonine protein kinase